MNSRLLRQSTRTLRDVAKIRADACSRPEIRTDALIVARYLLDTLRQARTCAQEVR